MDPFLGSEAIASGSLTRGALRRHYDALFPNVYVPKDGSGDLRTAAMAAWLWSGRRGIIAGRTAAGLYKVPWIRSTEPIEIIARNSRHPPGVVIRRERIAVDEIGLFTGIPVTTPERTAIDLARHIEGDEAVEYLDALAANTRLRRDEIWYLADRFRDARGIAVAREALVAMDDGVGSRWAGRDGRSASTADHALTTKVTSCIASAGPWSRRCRSTPEPPSSRGPAPRCGPAPPPSARSAAPRSGTA